MRYPFASRLVLAALPAVLAFTIPASAQGLTVPSVGSGFSLSGPDQSSTGTKDARTLDRIVAVVGEGVILESELDEAVQRIRARAGQRADQVPDNVLRSQVLDRLIMQRLQIQRARDRGIQISDAEVDAGLQRIAQQNRMDMQQFARAVAADGMSMEQLRAQVREELLISKLRRQEVMAKVSVSEDDVDRYLENRSLRGAADREYRVRHILVSVPAGADSDSVEQARERAQALRARIVEENADFANIAAAESDGTNAMDGGDLGWRDGAALRASFAEVLPRLQPGEVSRVFRDEDGFHLVRLEDVRASESTLPDERVMVEEVQASHILLTPNEIRNDERTRELARQLRERLEAGADFAALAREYSDDSATANQGGELGWVNPQQLDPVTRRQVQALAAGEVSPIFQTREGYEIVQVADRRERDQTREAMRERARRALGEQKSVEEGELWLRKLRDEAYVDIRMPGYRSTGGS